MPQSGPTVTVRGNGARRADVVHTRRVVKAFCKSLGPATALQMSRVDLIVDVIPHGKVMSDIPGWKDTPRDSKWNDPEAYLGRARSVLEATYPNGKIWGRIRSEATSLENVNLVDASGHPIPLRFTQRIALYPEGAQSACVLLHELGHGLYNTGLTAAQQARVRRAYTKKSGLRLSYRDKNHKEYFADSVAAFFQAPSPDASERRRFTPKWLKRNNPAMFALLAEIFAGDTKGIA